MTLNTGGGRMKQPETWGEETEKEDKGRGLSRKEHSSNGHTGDKGQGIKANKRQPCVALQAVQWPVKGNRFKASRSCNPA